MGRKSGSWLKYGCLGVAGLGLLLLIAAAAVVGAALHQNRSASFENREVLAEPRSAASIEELPQALVRLELDLHTAGVYVEPVAAGESLRIDAEYDSQRHVLRQDTRQEGPVEVISVELRPLGSTLMALLRVKLGARPPMLRIGLPRELPLELNGRMIRSYAAMELGGLSLKSTRLRVADGGVKVSFLEPTSSPMGNFSIRGDRGSQSITGLGNASPAKTVLFQHVGAVDVDLRGAWKRDAQVRLIGGAAGGSIWVPDNVRVVGLDDRPGIDLLEESEVPLPTLELSITERMGRFIVMD